MPASGLLTAADRFLLLCSLSSAFTSTTCWDADALMNAALKASYDNLTRSGVTNLHYVKGEQILGSQENEGKWFNPTVGGTHPADVGQYDMADFYTKFLRTLLA